MAGQSLRRQWWGMGMMCLAVVMMGMDFFIMNVTLPAISRSLDASTTEIAWIVGAYSLTGAGGMLPAGSLGDRFGRKRLLLIGMVLFGAGSVWAALSGSPGELIAARVVQGVGGSIILPLTLAITSVTFEGPARVKALALSGGAIVVGMPLGPIIGGVLLDHFYWGSVFWINVPFLLVALVGSALLLDESRNPAAPWLDVAGAVLAVGGIVALCYGVLNEADHGWTAPSTYGPVIGGIAVLAAFLAWERRCAHPLVDLALFRNRQFTWATWATVVVSLVLSAVLFLIPIYFESVAGNSPLSAGLRLIPLIVTMLVGGSVAPAVNKAVGTRLTVAIALVVTAAGLVLLSRVGAGTGYLETAIGLAVCGLGIGAGTAPAMDAALAAVGGGEAGAGAALTNTLRQVGSSFAVAGAGTIVSSTYARHLDPHLGGLPGPAAKAARESVSVAGAVADRLGPAGDALRHAAGAAFSDGMSLAMLGCAAVSVAGAVLVQVFMPAEVVEESDAREPAEEPAATH
ncbi:MFS transporter [Actinomadura opuntiae]|uniref:MFS transporter n=1 Tax=Actinomadura sp. OS1-43 TaxID=604315 RepID=UPI00255A9AFD|nr:MFS transporter [Actinomadura sp. OS1-43]MDL4815426.1 MFS transporter [Actinomadura sp. OS1-43]